MRQIVEYNVVRAENTSQLIKNVNTAIRDGFEPLGGVYVLDYGDGYTFMQAVVKYDHV